MESMISMMDERKHNPEAVDSVSALSSIIDGVSSDRLNCLLLSSHQLFMFGIEIFPGAELTPMPKSRVEPVERAKVMDRLSRLSKSLTSLETV
jgi:hypothetical protein